MAPWGHLEAEVHWVCSLPEKAHPDQAHCSFRLVFPWLPGFSADWKEVSFSTGSACGKLFSSPCQQKCQLLKIFGKLAQSFFKSSGIYFLKNNLFCGFEQEDLLWRSEVFTWGRNCDMSCMPLINQIDTLSPNGSPSLPFPDSPKRQREKWNTPDDKHRCDDWSRMIWATILVLWFPISCFLCMPRNWESLPENHSLTFHLISWPVEVFSLPPCSWGFFFMRCTPQSIWKMKVLRRASTVVILLRCTHSGMFWLERDLKSIMTSPFLSHIQNYKDKNVVFTPNNK